MAPQKAHALKDLVPSSRLPLLGAYQSLRESRSELYQWNNSQMDPSGFFFIHMYMIYEHVYVCEWPLACTGHCMVWKSGDSQRWTLAFHPIAKGPLFNSAYATLAGPRASQGFSCLHLPFCQRSTDYSFVLQHVGKWGLMGWGRSPGARLEGYHIPDPFGSFFPVSWLYEMNCPCLCLAAMTF